MFVYFLTFISIGEIISHNSVPIDFAVRLRNPTFSVKKRRPRSAIQKNKMGNNVSLMLQDEEIAAIQDETGCK